MLVMELKLNMTSDPRVRWLLEACKKLAPLLSDRVGRSLLVASEANGNSRAVLLRWANG